MAKLHLIEGGQGKNGIIVASGWKAKGDAIRVVFRRSVTDPEGKRLALEGPIAFNPNDVLLVVPVKNKKKERSPDYVGLAFPEKD